MNWSEKHAFQPQVSFDGGDLDCGNGLLLLIRKHIDPLEPGQLLEILSTDSTVEEDLPAWSRMTGNQLISRTKTGNVRSYLVSKGKFVEKAADVKEVTRRDEKLSSNSEETAVIRHEIPPILPFAVMGIGSWPRPGWLLRSLHDRLSGRLSEEDFESFADDAVRLAVSSQERAGVDVVTDGEQRRDNYASFVGARLDNCQLIPITDLLPYVDDPEKFAEELRALDVPAEQVRHPAVFGRIGRSRSLAVHELVRLTKITQKPVKIALPGPYLLTRTMWLECVSDKAYRDREEIAMDIVKILKAEAAELIAKGAAIVQFDEPVLTEVVFTRAKAGRSFMCGALGEKGNSEEELEFAGRLIREVTKDLPRDRIAMHVCRGNWTRDESVALTGPYKPLLPLFKSLDIGTFFLEMATPRAGEISFLRDLPQHSKLGLGVVNQKLDRTESVEQILYRAEAAIDIFGPKRVWLNPDCGFATFADNPIASAEVAESKLTNMVKASRVLRDKYGV